MTTCRIFRESSSTSMDVSRVFTDRSFPSTWPVYAPARKVRKPACGATMKILRFSQFANWLENYAEVLELNVWTSSIATGAIQNPVSKHWKVNVKRSNGTDRIFNVKHVIFSTGFGGQVPNTPKIPGMVSLLPCDKSKKRSLLLQENFKGQILHSIQHKRASDHSGKKVVVVGACTSGMTFFFFCEVKISFNTSS